MQRVGATPQFTCISTYVLSTYRCIRIAKTYVDDLQYHHADGHNCGDGGGDGDGDADADADADAGADGDDDGDGH
eukprot:11500206-Karenia_brevis.AAC.1